MTRLLPLVCALVGCSALGACASSRDASALEGKWKVDLRPTPDSPAYYQSFVVERVGAGSGDAAAAESSSDIVGSFYGSQIEEGRINTDWNGVFFAFVTRDGSGAYNHSGMLRGGRMYGLSHSLGRETLWVWTARRE